MNVALIGYRGVGKSSVAPLLAERLGWEWIDADKEVERRAGCSIATLFATQGEPAFRDLEQTVLFELLDRDRLVIATGGGCILRPATRIRIRERAWAVWLQADAETIAQRLGHDPVSAGQRPPLTSGGGREEIVALLEQREPWYRETAQFAADAVRNSPGEIAAEIVAWLKTQESASD